MPAAPRNRQRRALRGDVAAAVWSTALYGAAIGLHTSLAWSSAALCAGTAAAGWHALRGRRQRPESRDA